MNMNDIRRHFGTQAAAAEALGTTAQVVSSWNRNGIPVGRQYEIQILTGGKLRAGGLNRPRRAVKNNNQSDNKFVTSPIDSEAQA